jgi:hypothetical protein
MSLIDDKWQELQSGGVDLGDPITEEQPTPDSSGSWRGYVQGSIYSQDGSAAWEVHGPILTKYQALGETAAVLGFPTSDQTPSQDNMGSYNTFEQGGIYWRPDTGAWEIHGAIYAKYVAHGADLGSIGYPISDEYEDSDSTRRNDFSFGSIVWSADEGAHYFVNDVEELDPITIVGDPRRFAGMNLKMVDFYLQYADYAQQSEEATGVPALFALAQSGIESGWGSAQPGNAMFGVKAGSDWTGAKQLLKTTEVLSTPDVRSFPEVILVTPITDPADSNNGKYLYVVRDWFRAYDSPKDSFDDHAAFLRTHYSAAFDSTDPYVFAHTVANGGYASIGAQKYDAALSGAIRQLEAIRTAAQADS